VIYDWDPDVPAPAGYELRETRNSQIIGVGIGLLSSAWVSSVLAAGLSAANENRQRYDENDRVAPADWTPLYFPVLGPFVGLGTLEVGPAAKGLLIADGVIQAAGALGIVVGILEPRYKLVRTSAGPVQVSYSLAPVSPPRRSVAGSLMRFGGVTFIGLGAGTLSAASITALNAATDAAKLDDECPDKLCVEGTPGGDALVSARDNMYAAEVLLGVGTPLLAGGFVLLLLSSAYKPSGVTLQAAPAVGAGFTGGTVRVQF
jgi:hypothetical protein